MAALNFPDNPVNGQVFAPYGTTSDYWVWNSTFGYWKLSQASVGGVSTVNGLSGQIQITAGSNVTVNMDGQAIRISSSGGTGGSFIGGVSSLNGLFGDLEITAGENISVTLDELSIRIASSGGAVGVFDGGAPDSDYGGIANIDCGGVT